MRAMLLKKPKPVDKNPLEISKLRKPEPQHHEIRIRVKVCGVCHTDLHTVVGELKPPLKRVVPGHQVVGVVDKVGSAAKRFKEGDRS